MIDIILCGTAYVVMVYFMVVLMKKKNQPVRGDDDDDGGISISALPDLDDLPPGVTLPGGGPARKKELIEEDEEMLV